MTLTHSLTQLLHEASPERAAKAGARLNNGSLTVTLTKHSDREISAFVTNGDGVEYGVTLTEHGSYCSCKDALYRGGVCKHAVATALFFLQAQEAEQNRHHLAWSNGVVLCGATPTASMWVYPRWSGHMLTWPEACPACVHTYEHPTPHSLEVAA